MLHKKFAAAIVTLFIGRAIGSMNLIQIKHAVHALSLSQLRKLDEWLHELIRRAEEVDRSKQHSARKQTAEERTLDNKTYRLEGVRCGKKGCKCMDGDLHGPYWYAYWSENEGTKSEYVGKSLPRRIERRLKSKSRG